MNFSAELRLEATASGIVAPTKKKEADYAIRRRLALKKVDRELTKGNFKTALSLIKQLQGKPFGLRGFGSAKQVPKNRAALDKFQFNDVDLSPVRPLFDSVMDSIEKPIQFPLACDEGRGASCSCEDDHFLCLQHEAGHFLVGYLLGSLPRGYRIPSVQELRRGTFAGGKVEFLGFEFLREVGAAQKVRENFVKEEACHMGNRGKISSKTLNNFCCILLGGLAMEHLVFGFSKGHYLDVDKLHTVLRWLGFGESYADFQVKWAALNTAFILHHHYQSRAELVAAMAQGQPVGFCIDAIENALHGNEI